MLERNRKGGEKGNRNACSNKLVWLLERAGQEEPAISGSILSGCAAGITGFRAGFSVTALDRPEIKATLHSVR